MVVKTLVWNFGLLLQGTGQDHGDSVLFVVLLAALCYRTSLPFSASQSKCWRHNTYKAQNFPNRDERQQSTSKTRARKLYEKMLTKYGCCVMDDETYIKADFKQIPGLKFFIGKSKFDVDDKFKKKKMSKFASKYLIWQAICSCGLRSEPFVTKGTVNGEICKSECLEKRLLPFLQQHDEAPLF